MHSETGIADLEPITSILYCIQMHWKLQTAAEFETMQTESGHIWDTLGTDVDTKKL